MKCNIFQEKNWRINNADYFTAFLDQIYLNNFKPSCSTETNGNFLNNSLSVKN